MAVAAAGFRAERKGFDGEWLLLAVVAVYLFAFSALPLGRLFAEVAVASGGDVAGLLGEIWSSRSARRATWHTIEASLGATAVSLVIGTGMALVLALTDVRMKAVLAFLLLMPLLIPPQITALAWLELLGPSSPVLTALGLAPALGTRNPLYSREGIMLIMGIEHSTIVFLAVRAGLRTVPRDLVEAARIAGAAPVRIVVTVVLPLLRPAIVAGGALAFVSAIGNFGIPALLGIPGRYTVLTTLIYQRLNGFGPSILGEVAALAMILAALAALGLALQALALRRQQMNVDRTSGGAPRFVLGAWRLPVEAAIWAVLLMISVAPLCALLATSFVQALGLPLTPETFTLDHYAYALLGHQGTQRAFVNSFLLATGAALAALVVCVPLAYLIVCRKLRVARVLDVLADAPYALPGIVLAIAVILVFLKPLPLLGISLYGTFWIILVAYFGRFLTLCLRPTISGLQRMDRALEEAAQVAGARSLRRLLTVVLPMVAPAAAAGALLVFMGAFNELTVSALLWSSGNETLGVVVFTLADEGNSTAAAAVAVLTVIATLGLALLATVVARHLPHGVLPWQA